MGAVEAALLRLGRGPGSPPCTRGSSTPGLESPFDQRWFDRPSQDHRITTRIDVREFYAARSGALKAHATQIDPASPFWFGLPDHVVAELYPLGGLPAGAQPGVVHAARDRPLRRAPLMAAYLSTEWFGTRRGRWAPPSPSRPGVSAVVQHVVSGGPTARSATWPGWSTGGWSSSPGAADEPDAALTIPHAEGLAMAEGRLDANAAFMQGRIKTAGRTGPLLAAVGAPGPGLDRSGGVHRGLTAPAGPRQPARWRSRSSR